MGVEPLVPPPLLEPLVAAAPDAPEVPDAPDAPDVPVVEDAEAPLPLALAPWLPLLPDALPWLPLLPDVLLPWVPLLTEPLLPWLPVLAAVLRPVLPGPLVVPRSASLTAATLQAPSRERAAARRRMRDMGERSRWRPAISAIAPRMLRAIAARMTAA